MASYDPFYLRSTRTVYAVAFTTLVLLTAPLLFSAYAENVVTVELSMADVDAIAPALHALVQPPHPFTAPAALETLEVRSAQALTQRVLATARSGPSLSPAASLAICIESYSKRHLPVSKDYAIFNPGSNVKRLYAQDFDADPTPRHALRC